MPGAQAHKKIINKSITFLERSFSCILPSRYRLLFPEYGLQEARFLHTLSRKPASGCCYGRGPGRPAELSQRTVMVQLFPFVRSRSCFLRLQPLRFCLYNLSVRLLLLNLYYPPDTSATAKMAQTVVHALSAKHDVTVLCGRPSYDPTERRPWRLFQREHSGRVRIIRAGSSDYSRTQMKKRVFNYLSYVLLAAPRALFLP